MSDANLILEKTESCVIATINRPKYNFFSLEIVNEINEVLEKFRNDWSVRSIIITAAGDQFFTAGWDIRSKEAFNYHESLRFRQVIHAVETYPKPVIIAMNGHSFGGGCELALGCHFRVIDETARIGLVETNVAWIPGGGGSQRLPRLIGKTKAFEYMAFGTQIPAEEAYRVGLVNRVSKKGGVRQDAVELARRIAERPPLALAALIDCLNRGLEVPLEKGLEIEMENLIKLLKTRDFKEGVEAFFEKRKPVYTAE